MEETKMKTIHDFALLLALCVSMISCKSPLESDQTNDPPIVTVVGNDTTISIGDTLRLTIHASDATLTSGTIDFKDSSIVILNNLKSVLDTTLIHIFTSIGSYDITAL
jgi:hypothetical protein